ncbi:MAG: alanyl-tRNA editing protein [Chloroflexota bacterium]|nr:MAG: alanyl-tRNA editing protein [Chloroflexota bacterium]
MTVPLYYEDAYSTACEARVVARGDDGIILDRSVFYPGGGGQPSDRGIIRWGETEARVTDIRRGPAGAVHVLDVPGPAVGESVECAIDWARRHALMRAHTALHILCGVIWRDFKASVTGAQMEVGAARMDFELERMDAEFSRDIEARALAEIEASRVVTSRDLPRDEAFEIPDLIRTRINLLPPGIIRVRVVEIVGLDLQADGGTHVANTRHVGAFRVVGHESKGRLNKRLRIALD